ncbi:DUF4270 domain-containing protein [Flavobacterium branchiicola]|uniref:DUF4270 domain-containing protein n=1 Tax=Flavobacterium branchiicola TaxID=1114875 RepID=A0ABV9PMI1_9FLAO|nr:DUF4270 domain-containing protein [Flavobacterium branchiicola]MBS7256130.1 DUF4270 domain-containing protein [Flavobacterium branchiicola]
MYNTSFIKKILLVATVVLLYSCDKDFNAIGDDLIGDNHFDLVPQDYGVVAYNQEITPIQSNSLGVNALGIYDNPVLGATTANYTTQVSLAAYAPTIGADPEIQSVVLSVPYFSKAQTAKPEGGSTYKLDSIYGAANGKLNLSVYESGIQMRGSFFDNGVQYPQFYYTDMDTNTDPNYINFDSKKVGSKLNDDANEAQNTKFFFDSEEIVEETTDAAGVKTTNRSAPAMHLNLNKAFFQEKILKAATSKLASADAFQEYFRGLYFKVEKTADGGPSNMALINFAKGKITIKYKAKTASTTDAAETTEDKSLEISLTGATAGLLKDNKSQEYSDAIKTASINTTSGDSKLYLKGGQGSLAVIELKDFGAQLEEIKKSNWIVNEANLVFTIDAEKMAVKGSDNLAAKEPRRVYLYDLTNNVPLVDYTADRTTSLSTADPAMSKVIFGGIINLDPTTKRGTTYKIRLTQHVRNLIKSSTAVNVKLGLVVIDDITVTASNKLKVKNDVITDAPRATVVAPLGTILFGNNIPSTDANYNKRLKLEVYYTKPN